MTRSHSSLQMDVGFAVATALTTWVTLLTWRGFAVDSGSYLGPLLFIGLAVTLGGAALRWVRVPVLAVPVAQLALVALILLGMYGDGPLPTTESVRETVGALADAVATAQGFAAPVPREAPPLAPLLVACGALALLVMDLLAAGLGRVPASGLVLLMVYTLPVTVWGSSISLLVFVLSASGYLLMLFLGEDERFSQWGRQITGVPTDGDPSGFGVRTGSSRGNAAAMGGVATVAALVLPLAIPTLDLDTFGFGVGPGGGDDVTIVNPMTDLRRDLQQGADRPLVQVTTDQEDPAYLRYSVLTNFNGQEWTTGDRSIPDEQVADGRPIPLPGGLGPDVQRREYDARFVADEGFDSTWLPVPYPASDVVAPGVWKYDLSTFDFISGDEDSTEGLSWTATGLELEPTAEQLTEADAPSLSLVSEFTETPSELPDLVGQLAFQVTAGRTNAFEQAVTLQNWFRTEGGFEYSLDAETGNGGDELEAFLVDGPGGRTGYCEQFASAMAVMARVLGIPARVAVGFLRPTQVDSETYVYSSRDLHAWPELYFEGVGWVRFEPTPGTRTQGAPSYTRAALPDPGPTSEPTASGTAAENEPSASVSPTASVSADGAGAAGDAAGGGGTPWLAVVLVLLGAAVVVALALVPRGVRRSRRDARLSAGTAEAAWAELRDLAVDLAISWPPGRSPRATADQLQEHFAAPGPGDTDTPGSRPGSRPATGGATAPDAVAALDRLVLALEVERYSPRRPTVTAEELADDVRQCESALSAGVSPRTRRRAEWLPASVLRRRPALGTGPGLDRDVDRHGGRTDDSDVVLDMPGQDRVQEHVG